MTGMNIPFDIIDSHIHLYTAEDLTTLNWAEELPDGHPLKRQCSVNDYRDAIGKTGVSGFIFVETDRKYDLSASDWTQPIREVEFFSRIATGRTATAEGSGNNDTELALGMVPWAPMTAGAQILEHYIDTVREACGSPHVFSRIKGFRSLLQNQPRGTMLISKFLESLEVLHDRGYAFDLTIDCHSTGLWQMEETIELLQTLQSRAKLPTIVLDHCCKPNLCIDPGSLTTNGEFLQWQEGIRMLAEFPNTYIKLSGLISELEAGSVADLQASMLVKKLQPWANVIKQCFGPHRIMFGSDWPVCTVNGPGSRSWQLWCETIALLLETWQLNDMEKSAIWADTARKAYGLDTAAKLR